MNRLLTILSKSPKNKYFTVMHIAIIWSLAPIMVYAITYINFLGGTYPPEGDSFFIAFMGAMTWFIIGLPYFGMLLFFSLKKYKKETSIFEQNSSRNGIIATLLIAPGFVVSVLLALSWADIRHFPIAIVYLLVCHWLLIARSMISNKADFDDNIKPLQ